MCGFNSVVVSNYFLLALVGYFVFGLYGLLSVVFCFLVVCLYCSLV